MPDRNDRGGHGGEGDLAPVINLFDRGTLPSTARSATDADAPVKPVEDSAVASAVESTAPGLGAHDAPTDADGWWVDHENTSWHDDDDDADGAGDAAPGDAVLEDQPLRRPTAMPPAPVISLRAERAARATDDEQASRDRHPAGVDLIPGLRRASELDAPSGSAADAPESRRVHRKTAEPAPERTRLRAVAFAEDAGDGAASSDETRERGEALLVKRLRGRSLSVAEARTLLRGMDVVAEHIEAIVDDFLARGYLDDLKLADQLVHAAVSRKGQGRRAIAQALQARGIDRSTVDAVLADLPDDDEERALEFARTKAASLSRLAPDVALRRLIGQLARRGFGGGMAMAAAKAALAEQSGPRFR